MDISKYNRESWDKQVAAGNTWTRPVDEATDHWMILLIASWRPRPSECRMLREVSYEPRK